MGRRIHRLEERRFLIGRGRYLDDLRLDGMVHLALVRSPHAHARIRDVDAAAARALPGVLAILTGAEAETLAGPISAVRAVPDYHETSMPLLATDRVRFVGQPVAAVVAETRYLAADAVELIAVDYEPLTPVLDPHRSTAAGAPLLHDEVPNNLVWAGAFSTGDVETALRDADLTIEETFRTSRHTGVPMEGRGSLARYDVGTDTLEVWSSTQIPHQARSVIARCLRLPEHRIRVSAPDVGGAFGIKAHVFPEEVLVCSLARQLGRPVKWIETRREGLLASVHSRDQEVVATIAARRDGTILGLRVDVLSDAGAYASFPFPANIEAAMTPRMIPAGYTFEHFAFTSRAVLTNKCPLGIYRGVAQPVSNFVMERLVDRVAAGLGLDPAEVRFKNLVSPEVFPFTNAGAQTLDSGSYAESLRLALRVGDYNGLRQAQRDRRAAGGPRRLGIGLSVFAELCAPGTRTYRLRGMHDVPGFDAARVQLDASGKLVVASSVCAMGQGIETALAQLAADELGLGPDDVTVHQGDTDAVAYGQGSVASRSATAGGGAVVLATRRLREKIMRIAAHRLEADPADLVLRAGGVEVVGSPERWVSLAEIGRLAHVTPYFLPPGVEPGLEAIGYYDTGDVTFSNGAHLVALDVDVETGRAEILKYVVVEDCGTIINPDLVDGQVVGGLAQGLGDALFEEIVHDDQGQVLTASLLDYALPTAADVPPIILEHLSSPSPNTVLGVKGVGESGTIPAPAAVANAIADALEGRGRVARLPLTPERVYRLIQSIEEA